MAWCPQCKNEYRKGITICADCGCELVEEEQFDELVPLIFGDEEKLNSLKKYLEYNKLEGITVKFDETDNVYELFVRKNDKGTASNMTKVFLQQEALREQEKNQDDDFLKEKMQDLCDETDDEKEAAAEEDGNAGESVPKSTVSVKPIMYQNSSERAEENRSSAWMLLVMGSIGLVIMVLGMLGVIPFRLGNPYLFYGVMCAVFLLFVVMGVVSMKNAKFFAKKAESENTLRDAMTKWYQENLDADSIDAEFSEEGQIADEILYFKRVQLLKDKFNHQFMNLDQVFLEHYIDEEVYDYIFSGENN